MIIIFRKNKETLSEFSTDEDDTTNVDTDAEIQISATPKLLSNVSSPVTTPNIRSNISSPVTTPKIRSNVSSPVTRPETDLI